MPLYLFMQPCPASRIAVWLSVGESEADIPIAFSQLSESDKNKLKRVKHTRKRLEFLSARAAFSKLGLDVGHLHFSPEGKPLFENKLVALSHNHMYGAAISHDTSAVGIDVEALNRRVERIRHKFIHPSEEQVAAEYGELFLWVAKEAAYKMHGRKQLDFLDDLRIEKDMNGQLWALVNDAGQPLRGRLFHVRGQETLMCWCVDSQLSTEEMRTE